MSAFVAIVRREIRERWQILAAAGVAALIPIALPALRRLPVDARGWASLLIALVFALGIAASLGAAVLVPRIANRRVAFDLARPISAAAIWIGTVTAATILALAAAAIVWIPAHLAGAPDVWSELVENPSFSRISLLAAVAGVPALFAVVHGVSLMFRSRSTRLAVDAALGAACALGISAAVSRLPKFLAAGPRTLCLVGVGVATAVAFLVAGYASVSRGRTDIQAAHRAVSTVLWTILAAAVLAANLYAIWVMSAGPASVVPGGFFVRPADRGSWVEISGRARGARAEFLYDTATGRFERTRTVDWCGPVLSGNGKRAAWVEGGDRGTPSHPLRIRALDDPNARPVATRLLIDGYPSLLELSDEGTRLATWDHGVLSVHDLVSERTLASANVPLGDQQELRGLFVAPDVFRAYRVGDRTIEILQLDAGTRKLERLGRIEDLAGRYFVTDASGARLLKVGPGIRLYDGATGALLATLADEGSRSGWPRMLPDGGIVMTDGASRLRVFDRDGLERPALRLPAECGAGPTISKVMIGGEVAPDRVVVGCTQDTSKRTLWLADLRAGSIRKVADGLSPVWSFAARPALGSEATKLFYGPDQKSLVRYDPLTGQQQEILGARR